MITLMLFSAALGWCGTPFPGWWWWFIIHKPHGPWPGPDPEPYRIFSNPVVGVLGIVGGIIAGYAINKALPAESYSTIGLAAFAGGRILSDIGAGIRSTMK